MAKQCTFCGTALKDDARFCNHCGTLAPSSHPHNPKSTLSSAPPLKQTNPTGHTDNTKAAIREQIAEQPPYRSARRPVQNEPPPWISQLDRDGSFAGDERGKDPPDKRIDTPQLDFPEPIHRSSSPVRELHVKVWEQEEPVMPGEIKTSGEEDSFEDLPTRPLVAGSPGKLLQQNATLSPARKAQDADFEAFERLNTVPLAAQMGENPAPTPRPEQESFKQSRPQQGTRQGHSPAPLVVGGQGEPNHRQQGEPDRRQYHGPTVSVHSRGAPGGYPAAYSSPAPYSQIAPTYSDAVSQPLQDYPRVSTAPTQGGRQTPPPQELISASRPKRRKSRKPLVIVLILLFVLVIGGSVGTWIMLKQPFSVPGVTQPQQSFTNTRLGISLLYPSGWKSQVDQGKVTARFYDSSNTAQVNIMVSASSGGDMGQYLQQVANQLGMTGVKSGAPISFAGVTWQQVQGTVLQRGASYTGTLFVTTHNRSNVTLIFLAPQTTYAQEDQFVFSSMRSSLQFLP